jgi:hypothetical protein
MEKFKKKKCNLLEKQKKQKRKKQNFLYLASIEKMMRGGGNEKGQAELFHDGQLDAPQTLRPDELVERRCSLDVQPALKHVQIGLIVIAVNQIGRRAEHGELEELTHPVDGRHVSLQDDKELVGQLAGQQRCQKSDAAGQRILD